MTVYPPGSPCVNICTLNDQRVCLGCRRTLAEIVGWTGLSAEEQWRIVEDLKTRGADYVAPPVKG